MPQREVWQGTTHELSRSLASPTTPFENRDTTPAMLAPAEAKQLLAAAEDDRLRALYSVALALGLRQGEALGLSWGDVDLESRQLNVRHGLQRIAGELRLVEPKTRQ